MSIRSGFRLGSAVVAILGAALLVGCGSGGGSSAPSPGTPPSGGGGGGDGGGGGGDGGGGGGGGGGGNGGGTITEPTFAAIQANVFTPICTACHVGASAPQGLRLDAPNSYGLLVGVPSTQQPQLQRVAPGNPDASYLIHKLEGTAAVGERMPLGGTPLAATDIAMIRQWIAEGAMPEAPPEPPSEPVRVTSLSPLPDSTLSALPDSIIAIFDRELDATSVMAETFIVERSGGDGTFDDGNEIVVSAASVAVPQRNPTSAVFDLGDSEAIEDSYRVRLLGSGPLVIRGLDGQALDGEFAGTFPSGDGEQGGDFVAAFAVVGTPPTLTSIQQNVFTPICSACHTGPPSGVLPAGMDLSNANASYASLVGVASLQVPALQRVSPGNADDSYLVQKLEGTAAVGARMPFGFPPLDAETIDDIRQWIAAGAQP